MVALTAVVVLILVTTVSMLLASWIGPPKPFVRLNEALFALRDEMECRRMWRLFTISVAILSYLLVGSLLHVAFDQPTDRKVPFSIVAAFVIGTIANIAIYYWAFGASQLHVKAFKKTESLVETLMVGVVTLGDDTEKQLHVLRKYLNVRNQTSGNRLSMAIASPIFGIFHSTGAVRNFHEILTDWIHVAQAAPTSKLELIFWKRDIHRNTFGYDSSLSAWKEHGNEMLELMVELVGILNHLGRLREQGRATVTMWECAHSDLRVCIAGEPDNPGARAAVLAYGPVMSQEFKDGARMIDSLFFRHHGGDGLENLVEMFNRHKKPGQGELLPWETYLIDPLVFIKDFFGTGAVEAISRSNLVVAKQKISK